MFYLQLNNIEVLLIYNNYFYELAYTIKLFFIKLLIKN